MNEKEAKTLILEFVRLRDLYKINKQFLEEYKKIEKICVEKFKYMVHTRTSRYKGFINYEDLVQEGLEALLKSMKNYNPNKGDFFWWAHKYIDTRIARSANLHTAVRFPLKFAKNNAPKKENIFPLMIEKKLDPEKKLERCEIQSIIKNTCKFLDKEQEEIINLLFGLDGDKPLSISKVCVKKNITRPICINIANKALTILRKNIKI